MTNIKKIFLAIISVMILFSINLNYTFAVDTTTKEQYDLKTWWENSTSDNWLADDNQYLQDLKNWDSDFWIQEWWQKGLYNSIITIARDLKNLFFLIAWVYFLILVIRLLFAEKSEDEVWNFKKWVIWISVWIIVTQVSYYLVNILFDKDVSTNLASEFIDIIINPIITLLETAASFFFIAIMIYAFYKIVTSNWDSEKFKSWIMSVIYAAIWFIIVKISKTLVDTIYWKVECSWWNGIYCTDTVNQENLSWFANMIVNIISWLNSFVWIVVILMIIYAWVLVLTSAWDEEKLKKAKSIIIYIAIGLLVLVMNYLILTFFILPETPITNI